MKKTAYRAAAFLLAGLMLFSLMPKPGVLAAEPSFQSTAAESIMIGAAGGFDPMSLITGPVKMLAGRTWQELGVYSITHDVPGFSTFFKLLRTPAQRAAVTEQQTVAKIAVDVADIKASVARIENQLKDVSDKLDMYATAASFNTYATNYKAITSKYSPAWEQYALMYEYTGQLAQEQALLNQYLDQNTELTAMENQKKTLEESLAAETEESAKAQLQQELEECEASIAGFGITREALDLAIEQQKNAISQQNDKVEYAISSFIAICEEAGGLSFSTDLSQLMSMIWNAENPSASYLGSYEAFLRERYALEHEITSSLWDAFDCTVAAQLQILTLYAEYCTYRRQADPSDQTYAARDESYFVGLQEKMISDFDLIAEQSGFHQLMITEDFTDEELEEFRKYDEDFTPPENIHQTVTVGGKTYNCYKVRDNKDLNYYLIITDFVSVKDHVKKFRPVYAISSQSDQNVLEYMVSRHIYRPWFTFNHEYTDNHQFRLVTADSIPAFLTEADVLSASLRTVSGLQKISQNTEYVLLWDNEIVNRKGFYSYETSNVYWNMKFMDMDKAGDQELLGVSSVDVYNQDVYGRSILIYRQATTDQLFANEEKTWKLVDKGELAGKTVTLRAGQTLDMSGITVDIPDVTIHVLGRATIISNPNITLTNSRINIVTRENVKLQDLKLTGQLHQLSPIEIRDNATVSLMGSCSFTARSETLTGLKLFEYYIPGQPVFASHGMYIAKGVNAKVYIYGNATFKGTHGGAGVCTDGTAVFYGRSAEDKLTAIGSALLEEDISTGLYGLYKPVGLGAGMGASYSTMLYKSSLKGMEYDLVGTSGHICTSNLTVDAQGVTTSYSGNLRSEDLGGILQDDYSYPHSGGWLSGSVVKTGSHQISSNISTKGMESTYVPDEYTVTVSTRGSNGVTNDGIWINVIGTNGSESGWMKGYDLGNSRGETKQTLIGNSVGKIKEIRVKTVSDNHWYPDSISLSTKYSGDSVTVYGGRWIGASEQTLSISDNVYRVTVNTSNSTNAGTDANITLFLQDDNGTTTSTVDLSDIHYKSNAFEKGDVDSFYIYAPGDFGECRHAFLTSDHSGAAPGWNVEKIQIEKVQNGSDGYSVTMNYWYEYAATVNFGKYSGKTGAYRIEVKTGGKSGAGTDSDISIKLHGNAYSKNTGYINMGDMAGSGNNFEKNDLDCFNIGFNINAIGDVQSLTIDKNTNGVGPDWYLSYIKLTEIVADDQSAREYTFQYNGWIDGDPVKIQASTSTVVQTRSYIDPEILNGLEIRENGSYELTVDRSVNISEEILATLQETGKKLTVIMTAEDKPIYSVSFDGSQIGDYYSVTLPKGHGYADGNAKLALLSGNPLPAGTVIGIYPENLGFLNTDQLTLFSKSEENQWIQEGVLVNENGFIEIQLQDGKELLIHKQGVDLPTTEADPDQDTVPPADSEPIPETGSTQSLVLPLLLLAALTLTILLQKKQLPI